MRATWILLISALGFASAALASDHSEVWTEFGVEAPRGRRLHLGVREEARFTEGASRLGVHNANIGLAYERSEGLTLSIEFLEEFEREGDRYLSESRPHASLTWKGVWHGAELSDRNRIEARFREERGDLYRNRLQAIFPLKLGERGPRPFASEEVLVETSGQALDQNRLIGGLALARGAFSGKAYYMLLSADRDGWESIHVLGFDFTYALGGRVMMHGGS